jgi:hypothetical protein
MVQSQSRKIVCKTPPCLVSKITNAKLTGGVAQAVEHLLCECLHCKHETLSSNSNLTKRRRRRRKMNRKRRKKRGEPFQTAQSGAPEDRKSFKTLTVIVFCSVLLLLLYLLWWCIFGQCDGEVQQTTS